MEWILSVLIITLVILKYTTLNVLKKLEKCEDIILSQDEYIRKIQEAITFSENKIKEIDEKEIFKSDDEIGWFFNNIKQIQDFISDYKLNKNA